MKFKLIGTFLTILSLTVAVLPVTGGAINSASGPAPLLEKGPQATPANATATNAGVTYGLFGCQVGLSTGQCYDPYQMRTAYGIDSLISAGYTGKGKTIIILDAYQSANLISDLNTFNSFYGLPSLNGLGGTYDPNLGTFTQVAPDGLGPVNNGWAGEITLDVEWAHAIAPDANITLVLGKDSTDVALISALNYAVDNNLGDVVSMSFGESDTCLGTDLTNAWHQVFANATMKGITLFASAGDWGAALPSCDDSSWIKSTSSPASDPLVVGVGGTELHAADYCLVSLGCDPSQNPAPGTYQGEVVWNEADGLATGGGFSTVWDEPAYQNGLIHGGTMRAEPDVAYSAAVYHGVLVRFYGGWYRFGGTSAGSPQWAAFTAIVDQAAGHDYGFMTAALNKIGQNTTPYATAFHDITSGNNDNFGITGYSAGMGWDAVTGLGSPVAGGVLSQLPLFWSAGQGNAAISNSKSHTNGNPNNPGHMNSH